MESTKPKPKTAYERRKVTEERKKAQGLTKKSYYVSQADIDLIKDVKKELEEYSPTTNDEALSHILNFYRHNAL